MKFEKPDSVATCISSMKDADRGRSSNRALINQLFNGDPPFTDTEAEENNINTNVNFLDASKIAHEARNTLNNAFLKPGNFFTITLDSGPVHKRARWGNTITKNINRVLKRSKSYMESNRAEFAQVVLHGVGPSIWNKRDWCPTSVAIDDLLIPSRTRISLDNLDHFAVLRQYTPSAFYKMTHGTKNPGWNMKQVNAIWKDYSDRVIQNTNFVNNPEKLVEAIKEDVGYFDSDSIPTIDLWDFYHKNDESDEEEWHRKLIQDYSETPVSSEKFIFQQKTKYASSLSEILHIMFADGANVAPFRYHSVRGLGWLLYAVCHLQNRLRCKFNDAVFESMLWYFRVSNPQDREMLDKVDLHHLGVIPDGLSWVPFQERNVINPALFNEAYSLNRQSMAESAATFKSDPDDGTQREMTATEIMARVNAANSLVGSMLNLAYNYQTFQYWEICRRFGSKMDNKDVQWFRKQCQKEGVPEEYLDYERWDIQAERVLGAGNKTLEIAQARELLAIRPLLDPEPQRIVLHKYIGAVTDVPELADELVPKGDKIVSDSLHDAQLAFGPLMEGGPVAIKTGMNHIEYIEALLVSMGQKIKIIQGIDNVGTPMDIIGLNNVGMHISQHIQILAQDKNEKERVKRYNDALGQFSNLIKGFSQRLQEKMAAENQQLDPEVMADVQAKMITAQSNAKMKEASTMQKLQQKEISFQQKQLQSSQAHQQKLEQQALQTQVDIQAKDASTAADIALKTATSQT